MKKRIAAVLFFLSISPIFISQNKKELRIFSFDNLSKKPLQCEHYYCSIDNKVFKIHPTQKSSWFFEKEKGSHFILDYKKFCHIKIIKNGYMPELYTIDQMLKANDTAEIYLKELRKEFNYSFKHIVFKEDLSIDINASKFYLDLYKEYFLAKMPRLKITIVSVNSKYVNSDEKRTKAAYNLKKLLGSEERINVKIDNSIFGGNDECVFKITAL